MNDYLSGEMLETESNFLSSSGVPADDNIRYGKKRNYVALRHSNVTTILVFVVKVTTQAGLYCTILIKKMLFDNFI